MTTPVTPCSRAPANAVPGTLRGGLPGAAAPRLSLLGPLGGRPMAGHQVLVLRIGVRIPAPQLAPAPSRRRRQARPGAISIRLVTAPTVLILAAGQGTRMRSRTPKVLHELCGLPMVLWPVRGGPGGGSGADRGRRLSGEGARARCCPRASSWRCSRAPNGTGGAVAAATRPSARWRRSATVATAVVVLSGDVPLVSAEAIGELLRRPRASGAAATMVTTVLEDPSGYGRVVRDADGDGASGWSRPRRGRLHAGRARDPRGEHGHLRVRRAGAARRRCRG